MSRYVVMADFYANGAMKGRISPRLPRLLHVASMAARLSPPCFEIIIHEGRVFLSAKLMRI